MTEAFNESFELIDENKEQKQETLEEKIDPENFDFDHEEHRERISESESSEVLKYDQNKSRKQQLIDAKKEAAKNLGKKYTKAEEKVYDTLEKVGLWKVYDGDLKRAHKQMTKKFGEAEKEIVKHEKNLYGNTSYMYQNDLDSLLSNKSRVSEKDKSINYKLRESENELALLGGAYRNGELMAEAYTNKIDSLKTQISELNDEKKPENKAKIAKLGKEVREWNHKKRDLEETQIRYMNRIKSCNAAKQRVSRTAERERNYIYDKREELSKYAAAIEIVGGYLSDSKGPTILKTEEAFEKLNPYVENLEHFVNGQERRANAHYSRNAHGGVDKVMNTVNKRGSKDQARANENYVNLKSDIEDILLEEGV